MRFRAPACDSNQLSCSSVFRKANFAPKSVPRICLGFVAPQETFLGQGLEPLPACELAPRHSGKGSPRARPPKRRGSPKARRLRWTRARVSLDFIQQSERNFL